MKLAENKFVLVPAGNVVLYLENIVTKPKAKPTVIEATFTHENGGTITNKYKLRVDPKTKEIELEKNSAFPFSCLARAVLGNSLTDFSLSDDLGKLKGKYIECEVVHTDPNDNPNGYVFANIKKTLRMVEVEDVEEEDLDDEEDDL